MAGSNAADLLVRSLAAHGCDRVFCVPGESFLPVLDALHGRVSPDLVVCRHEGGAGLMALADAKLTGRPGVAFVSRGPGACNAAIAVHMAEQDAAPLVLFVGQVERKDRGRGAFQEVDYGRMFAGMAKAVEEVQSADRVSEACARAFHAAASGTPGAAVVVLPEDMLFDPTDAPVVPPAPLAVPQPGPAELAAAARMIASADRPILVAGGCLQSGRGRTALLAAAEALQVPVAVTNKRQDLFPNDHPLWAGHLGYAAARPLVEALSAADLVVAVGTRLGDVSTQGYALPRAPVPAQPLIHVHPDPSQVGRVFVPTLGMAADPAATLEGLAAVAGRPRERAGWLARVTSVARGLQAYATPIVDDGVPFGEVVVALGPLLPDDAILSIDAGNFVSWVHRHWVRRGDQILLGAVGGGMGGGVPGGVAAALRHSARTVVAIVGDGGMMMTGNEMMVAVARRARLVVIVADNGSYGTIRTHQERAFPGRVSGTDLANPDFAALARAFGARGLSLRPGTDPAQVLEDPLAHDGVTLVHVGASLEAISANATLAEMRARAG